MDLVKVENGNLALKEEAKKKITEFYQAKAQFDIWEEELKEACLKSMEENGIVGKQDFGEFEITYRKPSERTTIDSKRLKEELPDIAEEYSKTSQVKSSVSISLK